MLKPALNFREFMKALNATQRNFVLKRCDNLNLDLRITKWANSSLPKLLHLHLIHIIIIALLVKEWYYCSIKGEVLKSVKTAFGYLKSLSEMKTKVF